MKISDLIGELQAKLEMHGDLPVQLKVYNPKAEVCSDIAATIDVGLSTSVYDENTEVLNIIGWASNTRLEVEQPMVPR